MCGRRRALSDVSIARRFAASSVAVLALGLALAAHGQSLGRAAREPRGLLLASSEFDRSQGAPRTLSRLTVLVETEGVWRARTVSDPESQVFHHALPFRLGRGAPAILTLGGLGAAAKLWRAAGERFVSERTLWRPQFGGKVDRLRDVAVGDIYGDGRPALAFATHDQGVVAVMRFRRSEPQVVELDRAPNTWVHEVELGDLDGDGTLEVYATPSGPNRSRRSDTTQPGEVVRYVPAKREGRRVVASLGQRHAKEILVTDVDGNGRDELYVAVEGAPGGSVEIRRYDAATPPGSGALIATLPDIGCRFLVAGDVEGDGRRELVLAARASGLWLARPPNDPRLGWALEVIDRDSSGFEHAALLADLDADGRDELYAAHDRNREVRRYRWLRGAPQRDVIYVHPTPRGILTWSIVAAPLEALH